MSKIALNMIVKNESAIIERCLKAAAPHIDCYVICDTGSTDNTVELIQRTFAAHGIPGEIVHSTFENFEQARNVALDAARASTLDFDYVLLCDADMELRVADPNFRDHLVEPVYLLTQRSSVMGYRNVRLVRRDCDARYRGVTHEYVEFAGRQALFDDAWFIDHAEGSSRAVKYERDIALLTKAVVADPDNSRYVFYLAQSYMDCGENEKALETYQRRAAMGGWEEEVWYSLLQIANLSTRMNVTEAIAVQRYLNAFQYRPHRAEPLVHLARYYRENGARYHLAHLFAERAKMIPMPTDVLFIDESVYLWQALDEYAVAAYWAGDVAGSVEAGRKLLAEPHLPAEHRERVLKNLNFAQQKLGLPECTMSVPVPRRAEGSRVS